MMRSVAGLGAAASLVLAFSTPAVGQQPAQPQQSRTAKAPDPNEIVCEKQEDTGSRISAHRVCMTRGEWAEQRRLDRQAIDKVQEQRGCSDSC